MAKLIQKGKKYHAGHSYGTGVGYSHRWTSDITKARRYADDSGYVQGIAQMTHGKIITVPNTRAELVELGRRRVKYPERKEPLTSAEIRQRIPA